MVKRSTTPRRTSAAPPPADAPPRASLPVYPGAFVGRTGDLAALDALFARGERLVSLTGVGGMGKTRLAVQYAARCQHAYEGGVWFCDLSEARTLEALCDAVSRAVGLPPVAARTGQAAAAQLGRALAGRGRALLVLDNLEQVVVPAALAVGEWLAAAPEARLLVTTREVLRVPAECVHELAPLGLPPWPGADDAAPPADGDAARAAVSESVALLLDRAARARRGFALGPGEEPAAVAIVRQLDGIPLAIELAAARVAALGVAAVRDRLGGRLALLAHGPRTASGRQATLRGALDWSWDLLAPHEQQALAQCSVFAGGFTLEAAEAVLALGDAGAPASAVDTLQALRDKSLVALDDSGGGGEPRLLLYLPVREYAAEKLAASGDDDAAVLRHAAHFARAAAEWAAGVEQHGGIARFARLQAERENVTAAAQRMTARAAAGRDAAASAARALALIIALEPVVWVRGPIAPHLALLDAALAAAPPALPARVRADALLCRADLARRLGRLAESTRDLDAAGALAGDDPTYTARALRVRALNAFNQGHTHEAQAMLQRVLAIAREARDAFREAATLSSLADTYLEQGDFARARQCLETGLPLAREVGSVRAESTLVTELGIVHLELGEGALARTCFAQALALRRDAGGWWLHAFVLANLGLLDHADGALDDAAEKYERAARQLEEVGDRRLAGAYRGYAGVAMLERGGPTAASAAEAEARLNAACADLAAVGSVRFERLFRGYLAALQADRGQLDAARAALASAEALPGEAPDAPFERVLEIHRAHLALARARAAADAGDLAAARAELTDARARLLAAEAPGPPDADHPHGTPAPASRSADVRLALRVARRALAALPAALRESPAAKAGGSGASTAAGVPMLVVHARGSWFELPGQSRVDLRRHHAARLLLVRLTEARLRAPGAAVPAADLVSAGWPGERIEWESALNRLRVTVASLRKLGLRDALQSESGGYLLDPQLPCRFATA